MNRMAAWQLKIGDRGGRAIAAVAPHRIVTCFAELWPVMAGDSRSVFGRETGPCQSRIQKLTS